MPDFLIFCGGYSNTLSSKVSQMLTKAEETVQQRSLQVNLNRNISYINKIDKETRNEG